MALKNSEISRIANRKYYEVADDVRILKGWTKSELAREAARVYPSYNITEAQVYEWLDGGGDPRTSFSKIMEWTLGINLPPQCYWNVGKR